MASIVSRSNGTYLVRVSCGVDSGGKQMARSKTFKPSKPNLPYTKLNRELEAFVAAFEQEIENGEADAFGSPRQDHLRRFLRSVSRGQKEYGIPTDLQFLFQGHRRGADANVRSPEDEGLAHLPHSAIRAVPRHRKETP